MNYRELKQRLKYFASRKLGINTRNREYEWTYARWKDRYHLRYRQIGAARFREMQVRDNRVDLEVFLQTFRSLQYCTKRYPQDQRLTKDYHDILARGRRPLIVDAGAHVGFAARYFLDRFPEAVVVSVEPEPRNFRELTENLKDDSRALPIQAAFASKDGHVEIENPDATAWGFRTKEASRANATTIPSLSMRSIIAAASERWQVEPFIAKIDIEGYEKDVFSAGADWIEDFSLVSVELHDWMLPGEGTSQPYLKAISQLSRDNLVLDENLLSFRN